MVLRGSSENGLDEAERSLHDALAILSQLVLQTQPAKQTRPGASALQEALLPGDENPQMLLVCGAGAAEMAMAAAVEDLAKNVPGKQVRSCRLVPFDARVCMWVLGRKRAGVSA